MEPVPLPDNPRPTEEQLKEVTKREYDAFARVQTIQSFLLMCLVYAFWIGIGFAGFFGILSFVINKITSH